MELNAAEEGTVQVNMEEMATSVPLNRRFFSRATADQVLEGIDLTGRVAIVTG